MKEDILKEFDEKFVIPDEFDHLVINETGMPSTPDNIKDFISTAIDKAIKQRDEEIVKIIDGLKQEECCPYLKYQDDYCCNRARGYNQALNDLREKIQ